MQLGRYRPAKKLVTGSAKEHYESKNVTKGNSKKTSAGSCNLDKKETKILNILKHLEEIEKYDAENKTDVDQWSRRPRMAQTARPRRPSVSPQPSSRCCSRNSHPHPAPAPHLTMLRTRSHKQQNYAPTRARRGRPGGKRTGGRRTGPGRRGRARPRGRRRARRSRRTARPSPGPRRPPAPCPRPSA